MPSVNMIASRRAEKRRQERNTRKLIYGITAEIGCVLVAISALGLREASIRGEITDLAAQAKNLQPKVDQIQHLEDATAALQPKVQTLDGAKADTLFWYNSLYTVTNSLPEKTWLTSLGVSGSTPASGGTTGSAPGSAAGADPTVSIAGVALNQAMVGEAMLRMNQSPGMDHVDLAFVQQQKTGITDTVSFQMTAHLKPEPSAADGGKTNAQNS